MRSMANRSVHVFLRRPWWSVGQSVPGYATRRINETATRARAGLLNLLSGTTIAILLTRPQWDPVIYVGPFVIFDMFVAATLGLTPFSPVGVLGTALTMGARPTWKPVPPKRFAWLLGGMLGVTCLSLRLLHAPTMAIVAVLATCFVLTWLEAVLGFCVGCWMHSRLWDCEECDVPYVPT